jgi:hypothetical protein
MRTSATFTLKLCFAVEKERRETTEARARTHLFQKVDSTLAADADEAVAVDLENFVPLA